MLANVIMAFTNDIMKIVRAVMESNVGINEKVGSNTLVGSDIYKNLSVKATNDGDLVFDLMLNDYIVYIENGRRKGAKMPPIEPIIRWARKHGISTDNSTIYLIRRAISRDGIKPRPILDKVFEEVERKWNGEWSEMLFDEITKILDEYFN